MARLQERLESVNLYLLAIDPDYLVALDSWLYDAPHFRPDIVTLRDHLQRLERDVEKLLTTFEPKRGPPVNMPLEEAIRELLPLLEDTLNQPVRVAQNKHKGENPSMTSPGARAISSILRGIDPPLSETAIANMIERVRLQPEATETNEQRLTELMSPYDLSLMPNRHKGPRD